MRSCKAGLAAFWMCAVLAPAGALAQCYTVYGPDGRILLQGREAPVDMSRPLHETVPQRFPGGHLVFDSSTEPCADVRSSVALVPAAGALSGAPDTRSMGAARAAGPSAASPRARGPQVITELKQPPVRISREPNGQLLFESIDR